MAYEVLARKWRPRNFDEVRGQEHVVRALRNALSLKRLHHAYLFSGTRGVGKTTIARILAKCLNCSEGPTADPCGRCGACVGIDKACYPDLIEIDAASRTGVDDMRELLENVPYAPSSGAYKIYLIDEVHMLSTSSFNALLKTLEEPPEHVKFFFATTHPKKIPVTVLSRCMQFNLTRLEREEIEKHLSALLEKTSVPFESDAVRDLAWAADGSVRDALSLLDQAIAYGNGKVHTEETRAMLGIAARDDVVGLLQSVVHAHLDELFERVDVLHKKAADFNGVLSDLIVLLHEIAAGQALKHAPASSWFDKAVVEALAAEMTPEDVQLFYQLALNGRKDLPYLPDARRAFEMTLLRMASFRPLTKESVRTSTQNTTPRSAASAAADSSQQSASFQEKPSVPAEAKEEPKTPDAARSRPAPAAKAAAETKDETNPESPSSAEAPANDSAHKLRLSDLTSFVEDLDKRQAIVEDLDLPGSSRYACRVAEVHLQSDGRLKMRLERDDWPLLTDKGKKEITRVLRARFGESLQVSFEQSQQALCKTLATQDEAHKAAECHEHEQAMQEDKTAKILRQHFDAQFVSPTDHRP